MNVFKKIIFAALLWVGSNICSAQEISIQGGFDLSQFNQKAEGIVIQREGTKLNSGFNIGPIIELPVKQVFSIETGLLFTSKGFKLSGDIVGVKNYLREENLYYLEVPILFKATLPVGKTKIFAISGVYTGIAIYGKRLGEGEVNSVMNRYKVNVQWGNNPNEYNRIDYGLRFGAGIKIRRYQIGASYELGLKNISNDGTFDIRNRVLEFYIAYQIKELKRVDK